MFYTLFRGAFFNETGDIYILYLKNLKNKRILIIIFVFMCTRTVCHSELEQVSQYRELDTDWSVEEFFPIPGSSKWCISPSRCPDLFRVSPCLIFIMLLYYIIKSLFQAVKQPGSESYCLYVFGAEVKNMMNYISTPPYTIMLCIEAYLRHLEFMTVCNQ